MLKLKVCWWLLEQGKEFICEAESHDKKQRCDIVDLDGQIYEIVVSEGEASLLRKSKEYPLPITIVRWADGAAEKYKPLEKVG